MDQARPITFLCPIEWPERLEFPTAFPMLTFLHLIPSIGAMSKPLPGVGAGKSAHPFAVTVEEPVAVSHDFSGPVLISSHYH